MYSIHGSCDSTESRKIIPACLFENSCPSAARQIGQPMHSQSANFGKFKLNSHNLAGILLHHSLNGLSLLYWHYRNFELSSSDQLMITIAQSSKDIDNRCYPSRHQREPPKRNQGLTFLPPPRHCQRPSKSLKRTKILPLSLSPISFQNFYPGKKKRASGSFFTTTVGFMNGWGRWWREAADRRRGRQPRRPPPRPRRCLTAAKFVTASSRKLANKNVVVVVQVGCGGARPTDLPTTDWLTDWQRVHRPGGEWTACRQVETSPTRGKEQRRRYWNISTRNYARGLYVKICNPKSGRLRRN